MEFFSQKQTNYYHNFISPIIKVGAKTERDRTFFLPWHRICWKKRFLKFGKSEEKISVTIPYRFGSTFLWSCPVSSNGKFGQIQFLSFDIIMTAFMLVSFFSWFHAQSHISFRFNFRPWPQFSPTSVISVLTDCQHKANSKVVKWLFFLFFTDNRHI